MKFLLNSLGRFYTRSHHPALTAIVLAPSGLPHTRQIMRILIFPAGMPEAQIFAESASARGDVLIGASSIEGDPSSGFLAWEHLPFVTDDGFPGALVALIRKYGVEAIFTPHLVVWRKIADLLSVELPSVRLLGGNPVHQAMQPYRKARERGKDIAWMLDGMDCDKRPPPWLQGSLLYALQHIPGQSNPAKLALLMTLSMNIPKGDIVEIGSLWGRSAYVLALAAQHADTGPVICVEPWDDAAYAQPECHPLLAQAAEHLDAAESFECFLTNLAPFAGSRCNFIRLPASEAIGSYAGQQEIRSKEFGVTSLHGRIVLLHIDGNHDFSAIREDLRLWPPILVPGGWLVLDDYRWTFGDGPRRAGDEWLEENRGKVDIAFSAHDSLWIRIRS